MLISSKSKLSFQYSMGNNFQNHVAAIFILYFHMVRSLYDDSNNWQTDILMHTQDAG